MPEPHTRDSRNSSSAKMSPWGVCRVVCPSSFICLTGGWALFQSAQRIQAWHICQPSPVTCFAFMGCLTTAAWALPLPVLISILKNRISSHTQIPFIPVVFPSLGVFLQPERNHCPQPANFPLLALCACLHVGWLPVVWMWLLEEVDLAQLAQQLELRDKTLCIN